MRILGVYKSYSHRGNRLNKRGFLVKHRPTTKKRWKVFHMDDDGSNSGSFFTDLVGAAYYKLKVQRRELSICLACGKAIMFWYKKEKDLKKLLAGPCPACAATSGEEEKLFVL